ncbi:prepilin-type N-terminal cleavage/methylation domain-containing protein [Azospirillum sp. ST 5-10]|uniref:prepilin-type N-terminal cleavage/methylation domain-containing protein n=1 Tax=unclassified Azospirillum TaxID=2630922 RepID=UPI003F4A74DE
MSGRFGRPGWCGWRRAVRRDRAGFTLLEAVVALTLIAAVSVLVFRVAALAARTAGAAPERVFAVERARSLLAAVDAAPALADGTHRSGDGDGDGFAWTLAVQEVAADAGAGLFRVTAEVTWGDPRRSLALTTLRAAAVAAAPADAAIPGLPP